MIRVVAPGEMADLDKKAMTEGKVPGIILMENASLGVSRVVFENLKDKDATVVLLAGIGNNGGDGLCTARHLAMEGIRSIVYLVGKEEKVSGDALVNWEILKNRTDVELNVIDKDDTTYFQEKMAALKKDLSHSQVIVDALLGTGIKGAAREPVASVIEDINEIKEKYGTKVISVDIPSGAMGFRGEIEGPAVKADITVTFALPKYGHFIYPGKEFTGELYLCSIGITDEIIKEYFTEKEQENNFHTFYIEKSDLLSFLPPRKGNAHKGSFGHILVLAGSRGMLGASYLTVQGALKSGGGLVTAAVPDSEQRSLQAKLTEGMTLPLPGRDGVFHEKAFNEFEDKLSQFDSIALGPGIRNTLSTKKLVKEVLINFRGPVVVDADGLNVLSEEAGELDRLLADRDYPTVLTPHVGELERLSKVSKAEILKDPLEILLALVKRWNVYVLLKGAPTYIATPGGEIIIIDTGNPGMATGGSGDVLTGILSSFLAQKENTVEETREGVILGAYLHGLSGDIAACEKGMEGLLAGDIADYLPLAIKDILRIGGKEKGYFLGLKKVT